MTWISSSVRQGKSRIIPEPGCKDLTEPQLCSFNTSWIPRFPVEANGHSIANMWAKEAISYISLGVPHSMQSYACVCLDKN